MTLEELDRLEKEHMAQHEAYVKQVDAYLEKHQQIVELLALARNALMNQQATASKVNP